MSRDDRNRRRSSTTPRTFISSTTGKSTPATVTDDKDAVATCSWFVVPMISVSDLSGFSWRPFLKYHCLTSAVQVARTASPSAVLSARSLPLFSAHVCCGHSRPSQLLLSSCQKGCHSIMQILKIPMTSTFKKHQRNNIIILLEVD